MDVDGMLATILAAVALADERLVVLKGLHF
jgi:hypothetical protein